MKESQNPEYTKNKDALQSLIDSPDFSENIIINRLLPAQEGVFVPFPADLDTRIVNSLHKKGIKELYSHQMI